MSHISRLKTIMVDKAFLLLALQDLGFRYEEGEFQIRGISESTTAEIKVTYSLSRDVGFTKTERGYVIVADWWGTKPSDRRKFSENIIQRYAYHATKARLEAQGFTIASEEQREDGKLHMILRRVN